MSYLEKLLNRLNEIRELPPSPEIEFEDGEEGVGEISMHSRQLYALAMQIDASMKKVAKSAAHAAIDAVSSEDKGLAASRKAKDEIRDLQEEHEMVTMIMWRSIRDEFPMLAHKGMALRKGWQVVALEPEKRPAILALADVISLLDGFPMFPGGSPFDR